MNQLDLFSDPAEVIASIKDRCEDWWRRDDALQGAIAAWGAEGHANQWGVFEEYVTHTVAVTKKAVAQVGIFMLRDGVFFHCCKFSYGLGGFQYAPSVWHVPHDTEAQALRAGIAELLERIPAEFQANIGRQLMDALTPEVT